MTVSYHRKQYVQIAKELSDTRKAIRAYFGQSEEIHEYAFDYAFRELIDRFVELFRSDNPNFDTQRFREACNK